MATVSVRDLSIRFGALDVLDRLNLDVGAGDFLVLLGPSGCGKSTLLNAIAGLIDVTSGAVLIGGEDVTWKEPKDRGIAMVFQSYALYPRMTVRRNLSFGLRVAGLPAAEIDRRVNAAAEMLKITDLLDRRPAQISGGQRQRVAIGRALVREVGVFLLDEPLSNLDAQLRAELRVELKRLHRRLGSTMIYVTHDQIEALTLADRIAVMKDRVIQQLGTPDEIYNRPANRFVAGFVGSPSMNFLSGRLEQRSGAWAFVGDDAVVPIDGAGIATRPEAGRPVTLGIRPEHIVIDGATPGALGARVEMVEPMGADTLTWAQLGRTALALRLDGDARPALDQPLPLRFPAERLSLFDAATGARL